MSKNKSEENTPYHEANSDVDYRVTSKSSPRPKPKPKNSFWQKIVIALLLITISAGLVIVVFQSSRISSLESSNTSLQVTVEALQTQNVNLQATVETLHKLLTPTPTPKP